MQENTPYEKMISESMSAGSPDMPSPSDRWLSSARERVKQRKIAGRRSSDDLYSLIASFLNLRIRLYHAIVLLIITLIVLMFVNREPGKEGDEMLMTRYPAQLTAARNSTVLSSINTFVFPR
jgi:hypothetical protein